MDYAELVDTVKELILDTGRTADFLRLSAGPADAGKPWQGAGVPTVAQTLAQAATFVPATGGDFGKMLVSDELLKRCTEVCLTAPSTAMDLAACTHIVDGGVRLAVEWLQVLKPGDTELLYLFGVKR